MSAERWLPVPWAPGYEVSDLGRVRCFLSKGPGTRRLDAPRNVLLSGRRYLKAGLSVDGKRVHVNVHRLVLEVFVGPCPAGTEARHVSENDRKNNALCNLAWGTKTQNEADKHRHGTHLRGAGVGTARLSSDDVASIRRLHSEGIGPKAIGKRFGVSGTHVARILNGESWAHSTNERALEDIKRCAAEQLAAGAGKGD